MLKFRKRPIVIEAFQMTLARRHSNSEWPQWLHDAWNAPTDAEGTLQVDTRDPELLRLILCTREGPQTISWGDWIIQGVNGELYPCKPDIFEKTYDAVEPCSEPQVPEFNDDEPISHTGLLRLGLQHDGDVGYSYQSVFSVCASRNGAGWMVYSDEYAPALFDPRTLGDVRYLIRLADRRKQ